MFQGNLIELRASRLLMFHQLLRCCQQVWMGDCCWVRHHPNTVIKPAATPRLYLHRIWERVPVSHRRRGSSVCFICCGPVARWETFYHPYQLSHLLLKSSVSWISACQTTLQKLSPPFDIHVYSNNTAEPNRCIFEQEISVWHQRLCHRIVFAAAVNQSGPGREMNVLHISPEVSFLLHKHDLTAMRWHVEKLQWS